jgi:hypothetical protein
MKPADYVSSSPIQPSVQGSLKIAATITELVRMHGLTHAGRSCTGRLAWIAASPVDTFESQVLPVAHYLQR